MRDILVALIVFGALPFVFTRPNIGVLLWSWIGYMVPHRLAWGFAYNFPFAAIIGAVTILSCFISRKKLNFFWSPIIGWLLLFNFWMLVTTIFSLQADDSWVQWEKVIKIQLMVVLTIFIMGEKKNIQALVWVIALSIGFYGIKGGIFTIVGGGNSHVLGPASSYISGNTEIGLALVMVLPLFWYLYLNSTRKWIRIGIGAALLLIPIAILGTQSRGALLAIAAIAFFFWLKSRQKLVPFIAMLLMIPFLYMFMPQKWHDRMSTISYENMDLSAQGRVQAWTFAFKMALARPILGGGFESFNAINYERFAPDLVSEGTGKYHDVHSIYFEVLGEHGFVGLVIYLILGFYYWRIASKIMRKTKGSDVNKWAYDLVSMLQVSLVGYAVGGAFLGLAYFDLPYHLLVILVLVERVIDNQSMLSDKKDTVEQKANSHTSRIREHQNA